MSKQVIVEGKYGLEVIGSSEWDVDVVDYYNHPQLILTITLTKENKRMIFQFFHRGKLKTGLIADPTTLFPTTKVTTLVGGQIADSMWEEISAHLKLINIIFLHRSVDHKATLIKAVIWFKNGEQQLSHIPTFSSLR